MAYPTLVSLAKTLHDFAIRDKFHIFGDSDDSKRRHFQLLFENVVFLRDFLEKFTGKARKLETQIGESANEVECLIEYYISDMISPYDQVIDKDIDKLLLRIHESDARIESIVQEVKEMGETIITSEDHNFLPRNYSKVVVGIDDDISELKDRLFSNDSELVMIPIVGMGGIGKSTLARTIFDDPAVVGSFHRRRWVTISHNFNVRAAYSAILGEGSYDDSATISDLSVEVHQLLYRRKYLIVIDDIWSSDAWDGIRRVLPDNSNGSRVLLTTRDENVASYVVSSSYIHQLELMDEENSWSLFEKMVFGDERCPPELVSIGEKIIEGCHGLPIAISIMSGILSNVKCTADAWNDVAEDVNGALSKGDEHFTEILSLSYYRLPTHLKPCFLYFGSFPEDHEISAADLIRYWVADDFLNVDNKTNDAEEIAYEYLQNLVKRNLIMVTSENNLAEIKDCKIHDLLRETCIKIAKEENFFHYGEDISFDNTRRAASFTSGLLSHNMNAYESPIRVALCFQRDDISLLKYLQRLRLLRVLDVRNILFEEFPDEFLQLYHLRYLAFSCGGNVSFKIPAGISKLQNLETIIADANYLKGPSFVMPSEIWGMKNLRHLNFHKVFYLPPPMHESSGFRNLKTLRKVYNLRFEQHLVESIPNLENLIVYFSSIQARNEMWSDYHLHNLHCFARLETLEIAMDFEPYDLLWCNRNPMFESMILPCSLRELEISGCAARISWEHVNNVIGSLPNLEILKLRYVLIGGVWETREGNFNKLRVLHIFYDDLECWITESCHHFPSLESVHLTCCKRLVELPTCIGDIPTLKHIYLYGNHSAVYEWASQIEEEQRDFGNDEFSVTGEDDYGEAVLREAIEPTDEVLSMDELVEKLKLWAGDDEKRVEQAKKAGASYILSNFEGDQVSEMISFYKAMGFL